MNDSSGNSTSEKVNTVALLYEQVRTDIVIGAVTAILAAGLCWRFLNTNVVLIWISTALGIYAFRFISSQLYSRSTITSLAAPNRWYVLFMVGAVFAGLAWGVLGAVGFGAGGVALYTSAIVVIIGCLSLAMTAMHAGSYSILFGFAAPGLFIPAVALLKSPNETAAFTLVLLIAFFAALVFSAAKIRDLFTSMVDMIGENTELQAQLQGAQTEVEKLTVGLKTNADKRERAEIDLRRASADLGLFKGKAKTLSDTLQRVSLLCPITGLSNRRYFDAQLETEWRRMQRDKKPLSVIIIVLDQFDLYKQIYGDLSGDACLKRVGQILPKFGRRAGDVTARVHDIISHHDDSRFGLILPGADTKNAARIAEDIRQAIEELQISHEGSKTGGVITAHLGIATMIPHRQTGTKTLLERIDNALYEAQFQGGNRVVCYRTLTKLRLEHWDPKADGQLTEQGLLQKLMIWGYDAKKVILKPDTVLPDENSDVEKIYAILSGQLQIAVEGQSLILKPGNCVFLPPGTTTSIQVVSSAPVVCYSGAPADS